MPQIKIENAIKLDQYVIQVTGICDGRRFVVRSGDSGGDGPWTIESEWVRWAPKGETAQRKAIEAVHEVEKPLVHKIGETTAAWLTEHGYPTQYVGSGYGRDGYTPTQPRRKDQFSERLSRVLGITEDSYESQIPLSVAKDPSDSKPDRSGHDMMSRESSGIIKKISQIIDLIEAGKLDIKDSLPILRKYEDSMTPEQFDRLKKLVKSL